jgi:acyl carrier protein
MSQLQALVVDTVVEASNGEVTAEQLNEANGDLTAAGFSSMSLLNLMELLEVKFGVILVPERDADALLSLAGLEALVAKTQA